MPAHFRYRSVTVTADNGFFAFDQCKVYPLPENRLLVRNPRSGRHAVQTPDVYHALTDCREFRTLEGHAEHLCRANPALAGQQPAVRQVLESVRSDGLMISAEVYAQLLAPSGRRVALPDPPVVAVITWERPEALARCLASLADNCDLGTMARVLVIDDSHSEAVIASNRESTLSLAGRSPAPVHYVGAVEQAAFIERMVRQSPALEDAIRLLACRQRWAGHWTSGLSRTVALLLSVGERLLVLDDDIVCETYLPEQPGSGASFGDRARESSFFQNADAWRRMRAEEDSDALARHARILGLGLSDALSALGVSGLRPAHFSGAEVAYLEGLDAQSPVLLSECGSMGDPGTVSNNWLTALEGASLARLLRDDDTVNSALHKRNCWMGRSAPHVSMRGNMSQLTGLDNRRLLPPYFPAMRGEDRLFGNMLAFMQPNAVAVDQAFSIAHLPMPPRNWTGAESAYRLETAFPNFFLDTLVDQPIETAQQDPIKRLGLMAGRLDELAAMDHDLMVERYLDHHLDSLARAYCQLKTLQARTAEAPEPWRDYLDQAVARLNQALVADHAQVSLSGYPSDLRDERLSAWWRDQWDRFAHALRAWPAIRQVARHCTAGVPRVE